MFSGRRSARAGAPVGAPFAASVSGRTGVEVFSGKTGKPQSAISGHVADFARGKSEPGPAARSRTAIDSARARQSNPLLAHRQRASVLIRDDAFLRRAARPGFARNLPAHFGFHEKYCVPPCGCWLRLSDKPRVEDRICHRRNIARGARSPTAPWRAVHSDNWQSIANTSLAWISAPQLLSDYSEPAADGIRRNKCLESSP